MNLRLLQSNVYKIFRRMHCIQSRCYSIINPKLDTIKHNCIHDFCEFFLGKMMVETKPTKILIKIKSSGMEGLWHVVTIQFI